MKKILIKLAVILTILFIADRLVAYCLDNIFFKTLSGEKSSGPLHYLTQKKKNIDFLVLGSSKAKHQVDPALLTNAYGGNGFNLGIDAIGRLFYNNMVLQVLLNEGIKPKLIILHVDVFPYLVDKDDDVAFELSQLYPYIGGCDSLRNYINKNSGYAEKIKLLLHSYRYNGKLLNMFYNYRKRNSIADNNGFDPNTGIMDTTDFKMPDGVYDDHIYSQKKLNALADIIQTCKANNMKLVVLFSPSYKNNNLPKEGNSKVIEFLKSHGVDDICDFSDVRKIPQLQPADMWRDRTHLNDQGAAFLSKMLNDSLPLLK